MKTKEIKEYVEQGFLQLNILFEVVGNPKEHVELMIKKVLEGIKENKDVIVYKEDYAEAEDAGEGLWGTFCETEMLVKNINVVNWIAFNFSPASIEIRAPEVLTLTDKELSDMMGELLASLHQNNMSAIQVKSEAKGVLKSFNALARNAILLALSNTEKTAVELSKLTGINEAGIVPYLEAMIKEKTINKKGDKYFRL